jgi:hypothetical protein
MTNIVAQSTGRKAPRRNDATTLSFNPAQIDGLAATLEALGLPGTVAAIAGRLAQAGDEVVLRFGAHAYAVRRTRP